MTGSIGTGDQVDQAIAASQAPQVIRMQEHTLTINSTQRPFKMLFPVDITEAEVLEVIGWMGTDMRLWVQQQKQRSALSGLMLPEGVKLPPPTS